MRIFRPAGAPGWLEPVFASIERLFREIMPAPLRLKDFAAAELPAAADFKQGLVYDRTDGRPAYSDGAAWRSLQPFDATIAALAALDATAGLVEQTGADAFAKRAMGAGASTSVLTRGDGDGRYSLLGHSHLASQVADLAEAVDDRVAALLVAGSNIGLTYNDGAGTLIVAVTGLAAVATSGSASDLGAGTLAVARGGTGATATTGTGSNVLSASPSFTGTASFADATFSGTVALGDTTGDSHVINGGVTINLAANTAEIHAATGNAIKLKLTQTVAAVKATVGWIGADATDHLISFNAAGTRRWSGSDTGWKLNSVQVIGARRTGWSLDSGTARRSANTTYAAGAALVFGASYSQAEHAALATRVAAVEAALQDLSQTMKALKDDLHAGAGHGLIGP